jgi:hypothetical protein
MPASRERHGDRPTSTVAAAALCRTRTPLATSPGWHQDAVGGAPLPMPLTVRVGADDIAAALQDLRLAQQPAQRCPVARAVCRALQVPLGHVAIGPYNLDCEAQHGRGPLQAFLPSRVRLAIDAFDRWRIMSPFVFRIWLRPWGGRPCR